MKFSQVSAVINSYAMFNRTLTFQNIHLNRSLFSCAQPQQLHTQPRNTLYALRGPIWGDPIARPACVAVFEGCRVSELVTSDYA